MDQDLKQYLEAMEDRADGRMAKMEAGMAKMEARIDGRMAAMEAGFDGRMAAMEEHLTEKMRDMQTELLRGFASFSEVHTIRLRKVEADQSNLDAALSGRVNVLEKRLLEIELRLGLAS
jgi:hypothetical protein